MHGRQAPPTLGPMNRPGLVAQEDTAQDETTAHEAPVQTDLDLEMAGWPLLLASAVMMVQYVFARIQIDGTWIAREA